MRIRFWRSVDRPLDHAFTFLFKLLVFVTVRLSLWEHF